MRNKITNKYLYEHYRKKLYEDCFISVIEFIPKAYDAGFTIGDAVNMILESMDRFNVTEFTVTDAEYITQLLTSYNWQY